MQLHQCSSWTVEVCVKHLTNEIIRLASVALAANTHVVLCKVFVTLRLAHLVRSNRHNITLTIANTLFPFDLSLVWCHFGFRYPDPFSRHPGVELHLLSPKCQEVATISEDAYANSVQSYDDHVCAVEESILDPHEFRWQETRNVSAFKRVVNDCFRHVQEFIF